MSHCCHVSLSDIGRQQCESDALTGQPCLEAAGHAGDHSTAKPIRQAGPSLHTLRRLPHPFTLTQANDIEWKGIIATLPLVISDAAGRRTG